MTEANLPNKGQCRCGQIQFEVNSKPLITMVCHCTGCQRMTASAYSLSALYPRDEFKITAGEPSIGGLHGATRHYFCPIVCAPQSSHYELVSSTPKLRSTPPAPRVSPWSLNDI